ncbi:uncharacterized protein METZ01_LOCUS382936, partial [marine metagenome]
MPRVANSSSWFQAKNKEPNAMKKRPNINKTFSIGTNNSHVNRKTPWTRTLVLTLLLAVPILLGTPNAAAADDGAEPALLVNGDTEKLKLEIVPGSEDDFEVQLATDPGDGTTVVLDVTSKKIEQVTVDQTQLTFTGGPDGDWDKSHPVKVTTDETHHQKVDIKVTVNEDASNSDAYRGLHKKGEIKVEVKVGEAPESTD